MTPYRILYFFILCTRGALAEKSSKWDSCGCYFGDWGSWSQCPAKCGGGEQVRERKVWHDIKNGCDTFEDCATNDMGYDYQRCNDICYNGGTFIIERRWSYCKCQPRWKGTCCDEEINCGHPGIIFHGQIIGSQYHYGSRVIYQCDSLYNLTNGDTSQTCTRGGTWSGYKPQCLFAHTCQSNPCQNGGSCVDGLERYDCKCATGWGGVNCEIDVQPPVMTDCPINMSVTTSNPTEMVNWTVPHFTDPMNKRLEITKNYPVNRWEFKWGDYMVQYVATKTSNGLRTECNFLIKVRPHKCEPLQTVPSSAKLCTNWQIEFGQYCMVFCNETHTLIEESDYNKFFVCGASGTWSPANTLPTCERHIDLSATTGSHHIHFDTCNNSTKFTEMQELFITRLNASEFSLFCTKYQAECKSSAISITCV